VKRRGLQPGTLLGRGVVVRESFDGGFKLATLQSLTSIFFWHLAHEELQSVVFI
jgi:hypothetical protein